MSEQTLNNNQKEIIGIMGGTFNPIHNGHVKIAIEAHNQFNIPNILVMPSGTPNYKNNSEIIDATHRCNMVSLAIKDYDYMQLSKLEVLRKGNTYTADTLMELKDNYSKIYFLIGADSLFYLQDWYKPEYICHNCILLVANRDKHTKKQLEEHKAFLEEKYNANIAFIENVDIPCSSTNIRKMIKNGDSVDEFLSKDVINYIKENNLYE